MTRLVPRLTGDLAVAIECPDCGWRGSDDDPASGLVNAGIEACPVKDCDGYVEYAYDEGVKCGSCGRLDYDWPLKDEHGHYCSRVCMLQAEHARSLVPAPGQEQA